MAEETVIENAERFVLRKIQQEVKVNFPNNQTITIKHISEDGSIDLATFWLSVLQHQNNFPKSNYSYTDKGNGQVILKVDDVTLTTVLKTGTLMMQGASVLEWFLSTFQTIMKAYDAEIRDPRPQTDSAPEIPHAEAAEAADPVTDQLAQDLERMTMGSGDNICCVGDGPTYIYPLWKNYLSSWFSDPDSKVYLVSPFLDPPRLIDLCRIILNHRKEAKLEAFYVRQKCHFEHNISDVKREAVVTFTKDDKLFLESHVFPNIRHPRKTFHCKFIAYLKGNEAGVLVTSANFHASHFSYSNMETVFYKTMTADEFNKAFINPIGLSDPAPN